MTIAELIMDASDEAVGYTSDECLKCNVCLTVCPVARVTDLFPGPKYVGPQAQRFRTGRAQPVQVAGTPIPLSPDVTVDYCLPGRREGGRDEQPVSRADEGRQAPEAP